MCIGSASDHPARVAGAGGQTRKGADQSKGVRDFHGSVLDIQAAFGLFVIWFESMTPELGQHLGQRRTIRGSAAYCSRFWFNPSGC